MTTIAAEIQYQATAFGLQAHDGASNHSSPRVVSAERVAIAAWA